VVFVQVDLSKRDQGRWSVIWRKPLWPRKLRWIIISWIVISRSLFPSLPAQRPGDIPATVSCPRGARLVP